MEESQKDFMTTTLSSLEAYIEHRRAHLWVVRQRKLVVEKLKQELLTYYPTNLPTYYRTILLSY